MSKLITYGLDLDLFPYTPNQLEIELLYVAEENPQNLGGLDRGEHIKNVIKILYPWIWENWHEWNDLCLWAWLNYEEIGMTGCAAAHKTFTFSLLSWIQWLSRPTKSSCILTSTTIGSLRGRIWSEFRRLIDNAKIPFGEPFNLVDSKQLFQSAKGDDKFAIRALAVDTGEVEKAVGRIQGVHPENMILIVDEAAQTPAAIFTARANLRVGTRFYRFVAIANAVDQYDAHGKFCEPKGGWSTITVDDEAWETRSGICLHFDGLKSPNVKRGVKRFPRLFDQEEINRIKNDFGENSLEWWSYCRGFWAPKGVRNTVLDSALIHETKSNERAIFTGNNLYNVCALDPAFTTGGDDCILYLGRIGDFLDGKEGLEYLSPYRIPLVESKEVPLNYQIANKVIEFCLENNVSPENFIMDGTSASGLADIIRQLWSPLINVISFGGAPTEGPVSIDDPREAKKVYDRFVTQLWFTVQRLAVSGRIRNLVDEQTVRELCSRQYGLKGEKTYIEKKDEMKKRTSGSSPDRGDAAALLAWIFHLKHSIDSFHPTSTNQEHEWHNLVRQFNITPSYSNA